MFCLSLYCHCFNWLIRFFSLLFSMTSSGPRIDAFTSSLRLVSSLPPSFLIHIVCLCHISDVRTFSSSTSLSSKFLRRSLMIFIIKGFPTIVFIVISTTFRSIYPPAFFRYLSNSGTFTELRTLSFIESTGVVCSDSVSCNLQMIVSLEA